MTTAFRSSTTDGDQVVTIQDSGIFTLFSNSVEGDLVTFESYEDYLLAPTSSTWMTNGSCA